MKDLKFQRGFEEPLTANHWSYVNKWYMTVFYL